MITIESQAPSSRSKLLALAQQADPYPFLSVVEDYLAAEPLDDQMRACAMAAALKKGLYSVAIQLAQSCPPESQQAVELQSAAKKLRSMPSELLPRAGMAECFKRNLAALPRLADAIQKEWEQMAAGVSFHRANDGNIFARTLRSDGRWGWLPATLDFANQIEQIQSTEGWKGKLLPPFLLDGIGLGWLVPRLYQASTHTFLTYSPAIFIVEPNLNALAVALQLHDYTAILSDKRVFVFGGESAWDEWVALMQREDSLPLPAQVIPLPRWDLTEQTLGEEMVKRVQAHRDKLFEQADRRVQQIYASRDAEYWAHRFASAGPHDPLRVLAMTSRYTTFLQHSTHDLLAACERAGMKTRVLIEPGDDRYISKYECLNAVADFEPDLIVILDHHRHEYRDRLPQNVPFVCWIQDELPNLYDPQVGGRMGPLDFTIGYGLSRCVLECGYPAEHFMPCRIPVEPSKFAPLSTHKSELSTVCDVVYVSHQSETPEALHDRFRRQADPNLRRLLDAFFDQTHPLLISDRFNAGYNATALLQQAEANSGIRFNDPAVREHWMGLYVRPLIDRGLRHTTLNWVADWAEAKGRTLHLYGNGWDKHPRLARYAKGPAAHGQGLSDITRSAAINLHCGLNPALHQRVFEICASGGFLMVRYHPHDFYPPGFAVYADHVRRMGIERPGRIPLADLPDEAVQALRDHAAITGSELGDSMELSAEFLLELKARTGTDRRHYHAEFALPHFKDVTFDSGESFAKLADEFLADPERRQAIAAGMQQAIGDLFTYDALVPRIVKFVGDALVPI